jgi:hypothetical protein
MLAAHGARNWRPASSTTLIAASSGSIDIRFLRTANLVHVTADQSLVGSCLDG